MLQVINLIPLAVRKLKQLNVTYDTDEGKYERVQESKLNYEYVIEQGN